MALPSESPFHLKIFRPRNRGWGTKFFADLILNAASNFHTLFPNGDRVQVGDISAEYGGTLSRHGSHQNGLDADVAYLRMNHIERDPNIWGARGFEETFVVNGKLTKNFDLRRNWFLLKSFVLSGAITRIFVDAEIKRVFCARSIEIDRTLAQNARNEVLRRLRPYANHDDHFHIRARCPKSSPKCENQTEPPNGSGCDRIDSVDLEEHEP